MATIDGFLRLVNGLPSSGTLKDDKVSMGSVEITSGAAADSGTELTKAILDKLITLQDGSDIAATEHHHDSRYFTEAELADATATSGTDKIGDDNTYSNFTPAAATLKGALSGIDTALASAGGTSFDDATFKIVDVDGDSLGVNFDVSAVTTADKTITMPDSAVDLGDIATNTTTANAAMPTATLASTANGDGASLVAIEDASSQFTSTNMEGALDESMDAAQAAQVTADAAIPTAQKGANSGVATLDAGGKVPTAQLPALAITEVFSVADITARDALTVGAGVGEIQEGDVVIVTDASADAAITSGAASYIYNGASYSLLKSGDEVISVNSQVGAVSLDTDDISEGVAKYFSDELAQDAVGTILTDTDSLDLTYDDGTPGISGDVLNAPQMKKTMVAGEAFAANTSFLVRYAVSGETAGRVYKASSTAATADRKFYAFGMALSTSAVSAAGNITVIPLGTHTLGSSDVNFGAGDIGKAVWLSTAGTFSVTAPATSGHANWTVGQVEDVDKVWVDHKHLTGIA